MAVFHDRLPLQAGLNLFWEAAKQREDVGTSYETMYYSPVQRIFQIVSFKLNHESASKTKLTTKKLFEILCDIGGGSDAVLPRSLDGSVEFLAQRHFFPRGRPAF